MRAKNEFRKIAASYDTKLILERIVDGKLMCPEACCGSPVMECKCGPDCPHCNCHEIQKLAKEEDAEEPKRGISGYQHTDALAQAAFAKKGKTHKPYVSSYVDIHTGKKVFDVLDKHGTSVFRTRSKLEAYKWFKTNYSRLNEDAEEFDKEEDYWTPELTDEDKIKDHGPVIKKDLLTPEEEKKIDANREKLKAPKKSSRHWELNRPGRRDK